MTAVVILCFFAQGLLVTAYPTSQYDADDASMDGAVYPVEGEAAFSGIAPAPEPDSESVSIYGNCEGSFVPIPEPSLLFFEDLPAQENDELDVLSDTARFGSVLADSILAEREAEIEAKLAEIDAFVETEFGQTNSQVASTLLHINNAINSDLEDMRLRDALEFENIDDLESEPLAVQLEAKITADMANTESLVMKELTKVDSLVESELKKTEALMESEIEKVDSYIESKIAQNNAVMESEVSRINAFVESELAKTEALMQLELEKIDSFVESELAKTECMMTSELSKINAIMDSKLGNDESATHSELTMLEVPVEGVVEFSGVAPASGRTKIYGNTGYVPLLTNLDSEYEETLEEMTQPAMGEVEFYDTVPVSGRTRIVGYTGYLEPNLTPLKVTPAGKRVDIYNTVPVNDEVAITPDEMFNDDNVDMVPVEREVVFSGKAPALGRVKITGNCASPPIIDAVNVFPQTQLINADTLTGPGVTGYDKVPETVPVVREAVFSCKAPAQGHVQIMGSSTCPPVFPLNPPTVGNANPSIQNNNVQEFDGDLYLKLANTESGAQNFPCAGGVFFPINILPIVNVMRKETKVNENGDVEYSATVRVSGNTKMAAQFECAPLLPTEETPDGRKFIWLSKKSSNDEPPASLEQKTSNNLPKIDIPITTYSTDFPETIIMDSNKNYERFLDNHEEVVPVAGEVFFEGVAPAYGSVNISGQSSC